MIKFSLSGEGGEQILFLLTTSVSADCKYYATADVENDTLVNKKETNGFCGIKGYWR